MSLLAGCASNIVQAAQAPAPMAPIAPAASADGDPGAIRGDGATRTFPDEPPCPGDGVEAEEPSRPGLHAAVQRIARRYPSDSGRDLGPFYTGLVTCEEGNFFTVFRVPGGTAFDAWIRKVARRHDVRVHLRDARYPRAQIQATRKLVTWRAVRLEQQGARLGLMWYEFRDGGYLRVGIRGDLAAARQVLADLAERVRVVEEQMSSAPN